MWKVATAWLLGFAAGYLLCFGTVGVIVFMFFGTLPAGFFSAPFGFGAAASLPNKLNSPLFEAVMTGGSAGLVALVGLTWGRAYASFAHREGLGPGYFMRRFVMPRLTRPLQRFGFLVLVGGVVLVVLAATVYGPSLSGFLEQMLFFTPFPARFLNYSNSVSRLLFRLGTSLVGCGLVLSFLYDVSLGRLIAWTRGEPLS